MRQSTHDQILKIKDEYESFRKHTRADERLSAEAKDGDCKAAHAEATKKIQQLREQEKAWTDGRRTDLWRDTFGIGDSGESMAYRHASDEVAKAASPEDLGRLMEAASKVGDTSLLRMAAGAAWDQRASKINGQHYRELVKTYVGEKDALEEIDALDDSDRGDFMRGFEYVLSAPEERPTVQPSWANPMAGANPGHDRSTPVRGAM